MQGSGDMKEVNPLRTPGAISVSFNAGDERTIFVVQWVFGTAFGLSRPAALKAIHYNEIDVVVFLRVVLPATGRGNELD